MSNKDLSMGSGLTPKPSPEERKGEGSRIKTEEDLGERSPWDSLRPAVPKEDVPKPPSRLVIFLRKLLRWTVGILVIFALGILATWITRVQPQKDRINALNDKLEAADITVEELESRMTELLPVVDENNALKGQLNQAQLQVDVFKVLVDVTTAELALVNEDVLTAKASLSGTDSQLETLQEGLPQADQATIEGMRTRLALVLDELETDVFAAGNDLEVLKNNLVALERSLFGD
jgi:hypothetical protein